MKSSVFAVVMALLFLVPAEGFGTTYYIDFSTGADSNPGTSPTAPWKRAPGMAGFAGAYTHSAGDQFIFRGGVVWDNTVARWTISNSGAPGFPDYYGVNQSWFAGTAWSKPVFDGGSLNPVKATPYIYVTGSYVTMDSLMVQNIGVPGINQGNYAIEFLNTHDILVQNMTLPVMSRIALFFVNSSGAIRSNFEVMNNDISACSWGVAMGTSGANSVFTNVKIHDNAIHDFHLQMANSVHGDGVYLYGPGNDASQYFDAVYIYNNLFYGDFSVSDTSTAAMSAFIWPSSPAGTAYVFNNRTSYTAGSLGAAYFAGGGWSGFTGTGTVYLYNNTQVGNASCYFFLSGSGLATLVSMNNISYGSSSVYAIAPYSPVANFTSDYNDFYGWTSSVFAGVRGTNQSYTQFRTAGYEAHGLNVDPQFVSPPLNILLQSTSPVIQKGLSQATVFSFDAGYSTRGPAWDIGAYAYLGTVTNTMPNPPSALAVTKVN